MKENLEKFKFKIKEARSRLNLTQKDIATKVGISTTAYYTLENARWANNYFMKQDTIVKVLDILELDVDYMLALLDQVKESKIEEFKKIQIKKNLKNDK